MNGPERAPAPSLIDSDILIDAGRLVSDAVECIRDIEERSTGVISAISYMVMVGCRSAAELRRTERFLRRFQLLTLDDTISRLAINLLRRYRRVMAR